MIFARRMAAIAAFAAVAAIVALALAPAIVPKFGYEVVCVKSGSMAPRMPTGSLVVIRVATPAESARLHAGDVIMFHEPTGPQRLVTHRIARIEFDSQGQLQFVTKGDANGVTDPWRVKPTNIVGVRTFHIHYAGYLQVLLGEWPIRICLITAAGILFFWSPKAKLRRIEPDDTELPTAA